jgi:hypothetical protein
VTAANSLHRSFGKLELPLAVTRETDFSSLDPARDILLDLFAAALTAELLPRWQHATETTPLWGKAVVQTKFPEFPEQVFLQQVAVEWPLLAVYRSDAAETFDEHTLWEERVTGRWGVDYCIGPLEVGNYVKLSEVLRAVPRILEGVIRTGGHLAYATQTNVNSTFVKQVFGKGDGCCGFSTIRVVEAISGSAAFAQGGPKFHCASVVIETTELSALNAGVAPPYTGSSFTLETGDTSGLRPLVSGDTAIPLPK